MRFLQNLLQNCPKYWTSPLTYFPTQSKCVGGGGGGFGDNCIKKNFFLFFFSLIFFLYFTSFSFSFLYFHVFPFRRIKPDLRIRDYVVVRLLGSGSFAQVYLVWCFQNICIIIIVIYCFVLFHLFHLFSLSSLSLTVGQTLVH